MANFGGFEIEDDVQESPSASTFGGFEIEDEEPSAPAVDVQAGLEQPAAEPAPKKRGITMSPDEMNVPAASLLTKEEAKNMGEMSASEIAARSYEQTTGADAPESGFLAQLANMGLAVGGRLNANLQMSAAQQLASDEERKDLDTSKLFSQMIFGLGKYNFFRPASALDEWDDSDGLSYKTPEERTAARNAFARELARQFIAERTATKQNAATELENREQGHVATIFGKGPAQVGYSLPYMLGPIGIGLQFAEESAANAVELSNDEYGFAKDGSLGVVAEGDSAGKAAFKGAVSSGIETATEIVGGKLASAVLKRGGKVLVGRFPVITENAGKIAQTKVGQAVSKFGGKMKDAFKLVSKKMHWDGLPEETIEEYESDVLNSLFGTRKRDSEYVDAETGKPLGAGGRLWESTKEFFTPKNFIELQEAMLLTMGAGGFMAHMSQRGAQKQVDSFLESKGIMDAEEIKKADLQTKVAAMDAYTQGLSEKQIREKLDTASGLLDRANKWFEKGLSKIAGEETETDKVVTLKNFLSEMDSYNSLTERATEVDAAARERGEYTKRFTVQTDENGKPKFRQTIVGSPATGESVTRNEMHDADAGVTVIDTAGVYEVKSDVTGETFRTQSFSRAINAADSMAVLNQQRVAERQAKAQVLSDILGGEQYAGRKFEIVETAQQAHDAFGGDIENDTPGFTTADGTTVLILDNLDDPKTALDALDLGTPNDRGAFADGVKFETVAAKDDDGEIVETRVARDKVHGVSIIDNGDGTFTVFGNDIAYENANSIENAIAIARGEKPAEQQQPSEKQATEKTATPLSPDSFNGIEIPEGATPEQRHQLEAQYDNDTKIVNIAILPNGEMKVIVKTSVNGKDRHVSDYYDKNGQWKEKPSETRADEAPAQPEQEAARQPQVGETPRNVETEPQGAEAPDAGVVDEAIGYKPNEFYPFEEKMNNLPAGAVVADKDGRRFTHGIHGEWVGESGKVVLSREAFKDGFEVVGENFAHGEESSRAPSATAAEAPIEAAGARGAAKIGKETPKGAEGVEAASRGAGAKSVESVDVEDLEELADSTRDETVAASAEKQLKDSLSKASDTLLQAASQSNNVRLQAAAKEEIDRRKNAAPNKQTAAPAVQTGEVSSPETPATTSDEERKAADKKSKRDAIRAKTLENAKAVPPPPWLSKNAGPKDTGVSDLTGYLANKNHNRASLHRAIQNVQRHIDKFSLAFSESDKVALAKAKAKAKTRLDDLKRADERAFAERNADIPKSLLERYIGDNREGSLFARWLEAAMKKHNDKGGFFFSRPRSAVAAKKAVGVKNPLVDAKYDGKLFDPDEEGADALNNFFDGMKGAERDKWLRILFGKNTKSVDAPSSETGNDVLLEEIGLSMDEALSIIRKEYDDFQKWRENGAESEEEAYYRHQYEEEQKALDDKFGPIEEEYALAELAAREAADAEYAGAMAYVENDATAKDIAVLKPSALEAAEEGDEIRIDHHKTRFGFVRYDAENGILYASGFDEAETDEGTRLVPNERRFRVTEDSITEIAEERENDERRKAGTSDNRASDEEGAVAGRGGEESRGGSRGEVANGAVQQDRENAAGQLSDGERQNRRAQREAYERVRNALDPKWQAEHPDEVAKLQEQGLDASAVASNPSLKGIDKGSWPVTATRIGNRDDAANIFRIVSNPDIEITKVLYLDEDGNILDSRITHIGVIGETDVNAKDIIDNIPEGTFGIVLSHNHPPQQGNDVRPTKGYDDVATYVLKKQVEAKGIKLLDHIITDHNAYYSFGGTQFVSDGADEFWNKAQALGSFFGETVEKPADTMNLVPYGERIDLKGDAITKLNALATLASKAHDKSSWVVAIDDSGKVAWIATAPANADTTTLKNFIAQHHGGSRYAVLNGENAVDISSFVKALGKGQAVIAVGENGKLIDFADSNDKTPNGLNDKILNAAQPAVPKNPASVSYVDLQTADAELETAQNSLDAMTPQGERRIDDAVKKIDDMIAVASDETLMEANEKERGKTSTNGTVIGRKAASELERRGYHALLENGKIVWRKRGENGDSASTAPKAPTPKSPAPRLANAPKLNDKASKAIDDILGEMGDLLKAPVANLGYAAGGTVNQRVPQYDRRAFWNEFNKAVAAYKHNNNGNTPAFLGLFTSNAYYIFDIINDVPVGIERLALSEYNKDRIVGLDKKYKVEIYQGARNPAYWANRFRNELSGHLSSGNEVGNGERSDRLGDLDARQAGQGERVSEAGGDSAARGSDAQSIGDTLRADVAPLSREDERKFRDAVERMVETLADHGYTKFDDLARVVASRRSDIYGRAKDLLRRSWNFIARDDEDEISIAQGKTIFAKIDAELQPRETTNDDRRSEPASAANGGAQSDRGERTGRGAGPAVAPRPGNRQVGSGNGVVGTVAGHQPSDEPVGERDGGDGSRTGEGVRPGERGGDGGESDRVRTDAGRSDVRSGEVQSVRDGGVQQPVAGEVTPGFMEYQPPSDLPVAAPKSQSLIVESSALASIPTPKIEAKPNIPDEIPSKGVLQAHQYHAVCQAVNAHNKLLPDGRRMGYFCGDGTGVGKTRTIAGVLLDAMNRKLGKGKALIVSKNTELFEGAKSDFEPFGLADRLFQLDPKGRKRLAFGTGIAFTTYSGLTENYAGTDKDGNIRSAGKKGSNTSRYAELVRWLGKDFDGVIAFDEAHTASKDDGGGASPKGQVKWSQAVIDLQNALPNARILYLTATSAYDAEDLRFLQRMGLWGEGTGFENLDKFAEAINNGGLSMMEMLTQGMKARGQYCSRSMSFKGVNCRREVAVMTPEQKETYNRYREVISAFHGKLLALSNATADPLRQLNKMYFGRALDLFNSVITAMKVKKAIEIGRQAIAEDKSPVFQLISTNEAAKNAKDGGKKKRGAPDLFSTAEGTSQEEDETMVGVKDRVLSYLNGNGFPVREWLKEKDAQGKHLRGEIIPEAVAIRDEMIALAQTLPDVGNPIDEIVKAFQDVGISVITGGSNKNAEADAFNNGKNLALVFSGAGGTGASYHADKHFENQRQRVQIPIEFGWEPDKFIQALGRSHRNNQVVPPEFVLLTTDIAGEMRFMSTIANRVASMGAIVGGDRNSSGQVVSASDSMDNTYGRAAIRDVARKLAYGQRIGEVSGVEAFNTMFLNPDKIDEIDANRFLGRMQFLSVDEQNDVYGAIADATEKAIAAAKADGTYDDGIRKIEAKRTVVQSRQTLSKGSSDAEARDLLTTSEWYDSRRITHEELEDRAPQERTVEYVRNKRSGKLYGIFQNGDKLVRLAPDGAYTTILPLERGNYETVADKDAARKAWDEEYSKLPAEVEVVKHYMSGDLIPVWNKIGIEGRPFAYRGQPVGGKPFIGVHITDAQLPVTLYGFGKKEEARKYFGENGYRMVREGAKFGLGAAANADDQPYFKRAKIGSHYVLAAFHVPEGSGMESDFIGGGWQGTWAKDETNAFDRGGQVYYRDFDEDAESAFKGIVDKHGVVVYRGKNVAFATSDELESRTVREEASSRQSQSSRQRPSVSPTASGGSLAERVGMPQMQMRVQNGELIITNTDSRHKDDLKLAFGGAWANRVRDGRRYVKSDLKWNKDPTGRGGWWSIPLNKVPADIRSEIDDSGFLRAPVAPLSSVEEVGRSGGVARLSQNPDEFKTTFVYNLLRSGVEPLSESKNKVLSEKELLRRALNENDMTAVGELYNRYMGPNAVKGGLPGLIRRAASRKGMDRVMNESRIEEVASLVWAGTSVDGGYELNRRGIIADINGGDTDIYRKTGSLIPIMTEKVDRILNDMAERAEHRPEMQTLDSPSRSREGESELDQQIADDGGVAEGLLGADAQNEYIDQTPDTILADKLLDAGEAAGRVLTPEERDRLNAMDTLDELMYFLPEDYQDVLNAVLAAERERGFTSNNSLKSAEGRTVAAASIEKAQKASGLSKRVFNARLADARRMMNEIFANIKKGKYDANIAIKASEVVGAQETDEELNESILADMRGNPATSDMALAIQLLLRGESVTDVADFFEIDPAMVRAWKARARNEHFVVFLGDEAENTLGLGNFPERKPVKRGSRSGSVRGAKAARPAFTPDLFAFANATVDDVAEDKISEGIAAGATDEQIAQDTGIAPEIVRIERIRRETPNEEPVVTPNPVRATRGMRTEQIWNPETGHFEERRYLVYTDGSEEELPTAREEATRKVLQGRLFAPVAPLEQETLGIEPPAIAEAMGYTDAAMNEWRSEHGFDELAKRAKMSLDDLHRRGAAMANNADEVHKMIERHERAPYAMSAVDQVALGQFIVRSQNAYNELAAKKREAHDNGNEALAVQHDIEMDEVFSWLDRAQHVNQRVGTEWGRAGRIRQITIDKAGNLADYMVSCVRAKGSPLTKSEKAEAELIYRKFAEAQKKHDNLTIEDVISQLDALSKIRLSRQQDGIKERKGKYTPENIERDYAEALAQIRYHGEHRSGGILHGLPNGQKWIRAIEAYHLMNGEGLTDGKPDGAKMAQLVLDDVLSHGVTASLWDIRQMESRMGNLIKPSQDEISKSLRDLHSQMLVEQQIEHILATGEMPPKTGMDRDEDSAAVRQLRRERYRLIRDKGIDRKTYEERLKSALDSYKTRLRNQIEENEKAIEDIEAGRSYTPRTNRKLDLDEEAKNLKTRNDELKKRLKELTADPAKVNEKRIERALSVIGRHISIRKEQIAAVKAGTFDFDARRKKLEDDRLTAARDELKKLNDEFKALKKALYPDGTDAEIAHRLKLRLDARQKQLARWNKMAADYTAADTWEERWNAVAPGVKRPPLENEATLKAAKERDAARQKVLEFRKRLEREDTRGEAAKAWARFIGSTSVLARAMLDMSVVGVQGGKFLRSHPVKAAKVGWKATKAFFKKESAAELAKEIANHPYFEDFKNHAGHIYTMEGIEGEVPEDFRAVEQGVPLPGGKTLTADMIPGVKRSNRSFAGFLNKAALELYADMVEAAGANGTGATDAQKKLIADFVNISLGYGYGKKDVGKKLSLIPAVLDAIAWAPRKAVAELKYAMLYPLLTNWAGTRKHEIGGKEIWSVDKVIGREYLRYALGSLAFGACLLLLAKLVNGDDDDDRNVLEDMIDPRSTDFGRVRIGNTSWSIFAGNEMVWRLLARLYTAQTKTNGVFKDASRTKIVDNYLRGKVNPLGGIVWDWADKKDYLGQKFSDKSAWDIARGYTLPLTMNALYENFAKNPDDPIAAIINAVPTFYGATSYTYERDPLARITAQGNEALRRAKKSEDATTVERVGAALRGERGKVYAAAKEVVKLEKTLKDLKALKSDDPEITSAIAELERTIPEKRKAALELHRRSGVRWSDMSWAE